MEKKQFKSQSKRLLDLMVNSIYTHKDIFLREIISNASDAVDKLCYLSLTDQNVGKVRSDFAIDITIDKEKRMITISDNGIGMTYDELEDNLGTIAKSGSVVFKEEMEKNDDIDIIGKFGVGFYSAFMVASKVSVLTRAYGKDTAYLWESEGADGYTITEAERSDSGTDVIIILKEDMEDEDYSQYLEEYKVEGLIKKHSDYIRYPIKMEKETENKEKEITVLNSMIPIWQRKKSELKDEDYINFYSDKFYDYEKPALWTHIEAEGMVSYKALIYVPAKAPYDYFTREYKKGLQLYSSGVLIMEACEELLPDHFRFVRGVVDSPDLSLNISREILQSSRELKTIASNIERKIKSELIKLLENDREKYEAFYKSFGIQLKYGITANFGMYKELLSDLIMFASSGSDGLTTLSEYVGRMKEDQKNIYYASGENVKMIASLPQSEVIREKNYEILYFTDEVDEFAIQIMRNYDGHDFKSVNEDEPDTKEDKNEDYALIKLIKEDLGDKAEDVKVSKKLKNSPVCITAAGGLSFKMEKYLKAVNPESDAKAGRILEINPNHELFKRLEDLYENDKDKAKKYIEVLYNQSLLMAGLEIEDPAAYSETLFSIL